MRAIRVGTRSIGPQQPCFIIAEAGVNHNGDVNLAMKMVEAAAEARADAIKFQTFRAEAVVTRFAPKAEYQKATTDAAESQFEMIRRLELSPEAHRVLQKSASDRGLQFLSTPFDQRSADFLEELGVPAFKVPSGEVTNVPFLQHIARKGRPVILSTGMSSLGEVELAVRTIAAAGDPPLALLHCVSNYPAVPGDVNLRAMQTLYAAFGLPTGYSDHTLGNEVGIAAAALGACIIEKHFTLDRNLPGPDHKASATPEELRALVKGIRMVESALGNGRKTAAPSEANTAAVARRSIVANVDLPAQTVLQQDMLAILRPGTGLPSSMLPLVVGRKLRVAIKAGELIDLGMLQ